MAPQIGCRNCRMPFGDASCTFISATTAVSGHGGRVSRAPCALRAFAQLSTHERGRRLRTRSSESFQLRAQPAVKATAVVEAHPRSSAHEAPRPEPRAALEQAFSRSSHYERDVATDASRPHGQGGLEAALTTSTSAAAPHPKPAERQPRRRRKAATGVHEGLPAAEAQAAAGASTADSATCEPPTAVPRRRVGRPRSGDGNGKALAGAKAPEHPDRPANERQVMAAIIATVVPLGGAPLVDATEQWALQLRIARTQCC